MKGGMRAGTGRRPTRIAGFLIWWPMFVLGLMLPATGCTRTATPMPSDVPPPEELPSPQATSFTSAAPAEAYGQSPAPPDVDAPPEFSDLGTPSSGSFPFEGVLGYHLRAALDYAERRLRVGMQVHYTNQTAGDQHALPLVVEANRRAGVFHLLDVQEGDGHRIASFELEADRLILSLVPPLASGDQLDFSVDYALEIPSMSGPLGDSGRQINFGDWYPFVPPMDKAGEWLIRRPAAVGEHLAYTRADHMVDIQIRNAPQSVLLASSGECDAIEGGFRCRLPAGRDFAWTVSPEYELLGGSAGEIKISIYVFPEHRAAGQAALQAVGQAIDLYGETFGPYPRPEFSVVESSFPDGMEYDGLVFVGGEYFRYYAGGPDSYLTTISVHEVSHQWWHAIVANDQAMEPWLDEALATYSEALFYERVYPDLVDWWWNFRVQGFEPEGWVDGSIYDHHTFRSYVNAVYLRGALFLGDLRASLGDPAFETFLQTYLQEQGGRVASGADFFAALPEGFAARLPRLIAPYFQRPASEYIGQSN
jgi:hypothetical protein